MINDYLVRLKALKQSIVPSGSGVNIKIPETIILLIKSLWRPERERTLTVDSPNEEQQKFTSGPGHESVVASVLCDLLCLFFLCCRGLFITIHDRGHISTLLQNWPEKDIKVNCCYSCSHSD